MRISLGVTSKAPYKILGEYGGDIRFEVDYQKNKQTNKKGQAWG